MVKPRKLVFMYWMEGRESALVLKWYSQYGSTAGLVIALTFSLDSLEQSHTRGWGRPYWRHNCLIFQNQDLEEGRADENTSLALIARMLSPSLSLQSWPNMENILKCSWAGRGRHPANMKTTGAGVAWWSLSSL